MKRRAIIALLVMMGCARYENDADVRPKGDSGAPRPIGTQLAWLGDLHQPESVRYDEDQDVFFISNMVGFGSAKDALEKACLSEIGRTARIKPGIYCRGNACA